MDDSIDSSNFFVLHYLPFIKKNFVTHMHGLAIYVKKELPFTQELSLEKFEDYYLCFRLALLR